MDTIAGHRNVVTPAGQYPANIVRILECCRFPLQDEKIVQERMLGVLQAVGLDAVREVWLSDLPMMDAGTVPPEPSSGSRRDIVDFMVDDVAIEVKIQGGKRAIYRQCERYCAHPRVAALILATRIAMTLPWVIAGKPVFVASLSRGWL